MTSFKKNDHENQYFLQWGMNYNRCSILHIQHGIQKKTVLPGRLLFNGRLIKNPITSPLEYPSLETRKKIEVSNRKKGTVPPLSFSPIPFIITQKITVRIGRTNNSNTKCFICMTIKELQHCKSYKSKSQYQFN